MKRFILIGVLITFLVYPIVGTYSWPITPYGVTQVVDLYNGLNWLIIANYTSAWWATYDESGNLLYFEYMAPAFASNGSVGWAYVSVNLDDGIIYVSISKDGVLLEYMTVIQYQSAVGNTYVLGGYSLYGYWWTFPSVIFTFAIEPNSTAPGPLLF